MPASQKYQFSIQLVSTLIITFIVPATEAQIYPPKNISDTDWFGQLVSTLCNLGFLQSVLRPGAFYTDRKLRYAVLCLIRSD